MTKLQFLDMYPWFATLPDALLTDLVDRSNPRFADLEEDAEEARRLWIAHKLTLFARTALPTDASSFPSVREISAAADTFHETAKHVGDVSVSLSDTSASVASSSTDLPLTLYGRQLLSLLLLSGATRYIP